jgi:sortase (surface protein transpeptidase)
MPVHTRPARSLLALALVVNLVAAGTPGAALGGQAADPATPAQTPSTVGPGPDAQSSAGTTVPTLTPDDDRRTAPRDGPRTVDNASDPAGGALEARPAAWIDRPTPAVPEPEARSVSAVEPASGASGSSTSGFKGRNHVWIPALGVDRSVSSFACTSNTYPGDRVYRWGCAGGNNVYLFGHAHSVFKPLHDAYVRGRLTKGMKVHYADDSGRVNTYAVSWWKVTTPDKSAWAYAGQSSPSLTLQTCVGSRSQYRLIVRLLKVG